MKLYKNSSKIDNKQIMKYFTKEIKIALTGIAAIAILFYGINFLKGINMFKASSHYYIEYKDACGLASSSPVYANGFNIGIVRDISYNYNHPGHVIVDIEVDKNMKIPQGTYAELEKEMLGTVKMNLYIPSQYKKLYNYGDTLRGTVATGLMNAATGMIPQIEQILPKLDSIATSLNQLLSDPALKATLHNAQTVSKNLTISTRQLNSILKNDIPQITGKVNQVCDNFITLSDNLNQIDYVHTMQKIDATLSNVKDMTDKLNRKDNSLGLLLNDREIYDNLNATSSNAANLLQDLKTHPKRYVHFSLFGKKDK